VAVIAVLSLAACGGGGEEPDEAGSPQEPPTSATASGPTSAAGSPATTTPTSTRSRTTGTKATSPRTQPDGTLITTGASDFGEMLFDSRDQAIYLFEPEADGVPACYGECEEAWPPVLTDGAPQAGADTDAQLLDTVRRRDGSRQVTYNGWPLYFYAHEGPGEVLCHDVFLNGGLWLAVGPDGEPLPT
jgi:predicted lipoprotein with Yx(FWY)xxD motif